MRKIILATDAATAATPSINLLIDSAGTRLRVGAKRSAVRGAFRDEGGRRTRRARVFVADAKILVEK